MIFIYLTPCVPLSFKGEGEEMKRGAYTPLRHPTFGRGGVENYGISRKCNRAAGWEKMSLILA